MKYCDGCGIEMVDKDALMVTSSEEYHFHNCSEKKPKNGDRTFVCYGCNSNFISYIARRNNNLRSSR